MNRILDTRTYDAQDVAATMNPVNNAAPIELAARRRTPRRRTDRSVARAIEARKSLGKSRGRVWLNGFEVGGTDPRFAHLATSHD
jgi:hypothetical protein